MSGAVVLFSGGLDSSTCLAWAAERFGGRSLHPLVFEYGQRHDIEVECADAVARALGVRKPRRIGVEALSTLTTTALTSDSALEVTATTASGNAFALEHGLPSTFVPARNLVFLALASAYGAQRGIYDLVTGVCEADAAGYPDCRSAFVQAANTALAEALGEPRVRIHTPLIDRSKADTFALAESLGVLEAIVELTHTCYAGDRSMRHAWGYGCGGCLACTERASGWARFAQRRLVDA